VSNDNQSDRERQQTRSIDRKVRDAAPPPRRFAVVNGGTEPGFAAKNRHGWSNVCKALLTSIGELDEDDPDRQLMARLCRLAAEIGGLDPIALAAPAPSQHEDLRGA